MATTDQTLNLLERARLQKQQDDEETRRKDARQEEESRISRRRSFGWALAQVLELDYDQRQQFPDDSFPGTMAWDEKIGQWQYTQDDLVFTPYRHHPSDQVLLEGPCETCGCVTYQPMSCLTQLVTLTDRSNMWQCEYCRDREAGEKEDAAIVEMLGFGRLRAPGPSWAGEKEDAAIVEIQPPIPSDMPVPTAEERLLAALNESAKARRETNPPNHCQSIGVACGGFKSVRKQEMKLQEYPVEERELVAKMERYLERALANLHQRQYLNTATWLADAQVLSLQLLDIVLKK